MPHILLETTADLPENAQVPDILDALVAKLSSMESVSPASVKAYHTLRAVWSIGAGHPPGFAHCTVSILAGRPPDLRRRIAETLYAEMRSHFAISVQAKEAGLTLELREMDADTYQK